MRVAQVFVIAAPFFVDRKLGKRGPRDWRGQQGCIGAHGWLIGVYLEARSQSLRLLPLQVALSREIRKAA